MRLDQIRHFVCLVLFAIWWGGLTFYAAVVVPVGTELFGSTDQGFVTQRVTDYLNWLGVVCLILLLWHLCQHQSVILALSWLIMALASLSLFFLHGTLDGILDPSTRSITAGEHFYDWHRIYLLATTVQWLAGLVHFWGLVSLDRGRGAHQPSSSTSVR